MPHDIAQICLNGHVVNDSHERFAGYNQDFCSKCGAKTIIRCSDCGAVIRGRSYGTASYFGECPAYCQACGKPYPWTESALRAAGDLSEELEISEDDKIVLKTALPDLVSDNAQTVVAASRYKRIVAKAGPAAAEAFKSILVNVVSEAAKKIMFPGS